MVWNSNRSFNPNTFREHVQNVAIETMEGRHTVPIGNLVYLPLWWTEREIRVFWEPNIPRETVDLIIQAIDRRARESANLRMKFVLLSNHESMRVQTQSALVHGRIDAERLFLTSLSEHWRDPEAGGRQHGDVYITGKAFVDDTVSWGAASFRYGTMVLGLHGQRPHHRDYLTQVVLHETTHLLGMYAHCDDYTNVAGYTYSRLCNMHYECPSTDLCPKCQDFLKHWWNQVRHLYGN